MCSSAVLGAARFLAGKESRIQTIVLRMTETPVGEGATGAKECQEKSDCSRLLMGFFHKYDDHLVERFYKADLDGTGKCQIGAFRSPGIALASMSAIPGIRDI